MKIKEMENKLCEENLLKINDWGIEKELYSKVVDELV